MPAELCIAQLSRSCGCPECGCMRTGERHAAFRESTAVPRAAAAAPPAAARMADGDLLAAFLQLPEARQQVWVQGLA